MKKNAIIWITALILLVVAVYVTTNYGKNKAQSNPDLSDNNVEEKAIDFTLKDLDGNKVSLSDFKGKNVYINFFATWCPPCKGEMPDIENVYKEFKDKDLVVLAVDLGEQTETVKNFIESNKYSFKVLLDSDTSVAEKYNISAIPVSLFIDKNGNIKAKRVGAITEDEMKANIEKLYK
jgi:Peroxiredoxin